MHGKSPYLVVFRLLIQRWQILMMTILNLQRPT
jgi:hypothetical protein